jgi:hypothetical protein
MFAYFNKINNKSVVTYINTNNITQNIVCLYSNEDNSNDDKCLSNSQTIANWINNYNIKLVSFIPCDEFIEYRSDNNIIPLFTYN